MTLCPDNRCKRFAELRCSNGPGCWRGMLAHIWAVVKNRRRHSMAKHSTGVNLDSIPKDIGDRLDADILRENPHAKQLKAFRRAKILYALDTYLTVRERLAGGLQRREEREMRDKNVP